MNEAQQIFCLFYAVFFGVLMSSLPSRSFPTDKLFTNRWRQAWFRLILSMIFINVLPAIHFFLTYWRFENYTLGEGDGLGLATGLLVLPASAFGMFAFNRWYFAALICARNSAFPHGDQGDVIKKEESGLQHILGSLLYCIFLILPWLLTSPKDYLR